MAPSRPLAVTLDPITCPDVHMDDPTISPVQNIPPTGLEGNKFEVEAMKFKNAQS